MPAAIEPFYAIDLSIRARELADQGRDIIHMEFGQPSAGAPRKAVEAARAALDTVVPGYWQSQQLKQRLARQYSEAHGVEIAPSQVFLTCGASPALVLALSCAFSPGDRIAIARPGYVAYRNTLKGLHMQPVEVECGPETRFQISADAISELDPAPAGIILASPSNPTGAIIEPAELARIAETCRAKGIRIISDEIYHGLTYTLPTQTMLAHEPGAFIVNSFSKYYCMPGWRMGWMVAPPDLAPLANAYIGNFFLTAPSLSQVAALAAMDASEELDTHLVTYARNRSLLMERLPQMGLGDMAPPDGAFYIYANVEAFTSKSFDFCTQVLNETGVVIAPGRDFDPVNGHKFIRFSFAVATPTAETAMDRLAQFLASRGRQD